MESTGNKKIKIKKITRKRHPSEGWNDGKASYIFMEPLGYTYLYSFLKLNYVLKYWCPGLHEIRECVGQVLQQAIYYAVLAVQAAVRNSVLGRNMEHRCITRLSRRLCFRARQVREQPGKYGDPIAPRACGVRLRLTCLLYTK